jgi:hypothetical protein
MKKIMFNDDFGLTQSVLDGNKKNTRRIPNISETDIKYLDSSFDWDLRESVIIERYSKYKVGEVVAIAQRYKDVLDFLPEAFRRKSDGYISSIISTSAGLNNKMFVRAGLMPHKIKITNIRIEKLQDISDEDCLKEGIIEHSYNGYMVNGIVYKTKDEFNGSLEIFSSPQGAYAKLIDKISGKGTWESNPYVFVYDFELIN